MSSLPTIRTYGVLLLLFVASLLNYFDRQTLSILKATGRVIGLIGAAGGLVFNSLIGGVIDRFSYGPVFAVIAVLHPLAALIVHVWVRPAEAGGRPTRGLLG